MIKCIFDIFFCSIKLFDPHVDLLRAQNKDEIIEEIKNVEKELKEKSIFENEQL